MVNGNRRGLSGAWFNSRAPESILMARFSRTPGIFSYYSLLSPTATATAGTTAAISAASITSRGSPDVSHLPLPPHDRENSALGREPLWPAGISGALTSPRCRDAKSGLSVPGQSWAGGRQAGPESWLERHCRAFGPRRWTDASRGPGCQSRCRFPLAPLALLPVALSVSFADLTNELIGLATGRT